MARQGWFWAGWLLLLAAGCGGAQLGEHEEAFGAVDALYTAVTTRRTDLLDQTEEQLVGLREEGKLSVAAWDELKPIIDQARSGDWRPAAERLYAF
ncbi:MAG: hypothetical protein ACKV0T_21165, partial [Planctomycetales bacterium]